MTVSRSAPILLASTLFAGVLAPPSAAFARPRKAAPAVADDADAAARVADDSPIASYIFDGDDVDGLVLRPEGMPVAQRTRVKFPSLLHVRGHFVPELVRLAKDL